MSTTSAQHATVLPGRLIRVEEQSVVFRQRFLHSDANLQFLDCGEFILAPGAAGETFTTPGREGLLYMWKGRATVECDGRSFDLEPYDTLYIPLGAPFRLVNKTDAEARVIQTTAQAENVHPVFHSRFAEISKREDRIRHLKGKDVYMMFDVAEGADKLVAGYTFFQPFQRSWPPHNHTDQEEVYIFIKGHGSMEVYADPETMSFVHNVREGDMVTIPFLNYHPVFSQEDPLQFIWCIAGARYWVGDKNKDFMSGKVKSLTT